MADPPRVAVIVPAYNEEEMLGDTLASLDVQTVAPSQIIVVDDGSTDRTGAVARSFGVEVLRPAINTGSKGAAQNLALEHVEAEFTLAIDADTVLEPDAIEKLLASFDSPEVAAACGFILPRRVESVWERGRYIEYMHAFGFLKQIQDYYRRPMISSGCFTMYRTEALREIGGWSGRTMTEDVDVTWTFYEAGYEVRFDRHAQAYAMEPHDFGFLRKQLRRWTHGFIQNVMIHWRDILRLDYLRSVVAIALFDSLIASTFFVLVLPILALLVSPYFLLAYLIEAPAVLLPVLVTARSRGESGRAIASYPSFLVLRAVNTIMLLKALWLEVVVRRPLLVYEKGH